MALLRPCLSNVLNRYKIITNRHVTCLNLLRKRHHYSGQAITAISDLLQDLGPQFYADGDKIRFLHQPTDFYQELLSKIKTAKKRITLASLYIGNGSLEQRMVDELQQVSRSSIQLNKPLDINILLDYTRGSRGKQNSRKMLLPLINESHSSVNVALFHTPHLRGPLKAIVPERFNETIGLSHLKVYLFDNDVIISGANLSDSYFVNRQDRYIVIEDNPEFANFFQDLITVVSKYSLQLQPDDTTKMLEDINVHPYENNDSSQEFINAMRSDIHQLLHKYKDSIKNNNLSKSNTVIFPLIQMGPFEVRFDEEATQRLFGSLRKDSTLLLASGYFNLIEKYLATILTKSKGDYKILTAAPEANGFYGASGIAGYIPDSYTYIAKQFYQRIVSENQDQRIKLLEYERQGWTFHVKGLWYYYQQEQLPSMTLIGSSNFGYRSTYRDLEAQIAVVTSESNLQELMKAEQESIFSYGKAVNQDVFRSDRRQVAFWAQMVTKYILWKFL
ncbi:CDP-diacylglycerol--glycerol-3-phosphate 3-phosphatidyltransferase, mitochondrial [Trichoplax sp. H2]|uniref:CDP-diacylglycerol--glycerol-3-phosphate 3-phosphatidyltransferase n=1 Tax=Trichoplax adhaerens TaxID=10228 RepID=B3RPT8_TRIAD|nr:hypothetical protein TRIADDRAFT_53658 [Trichoplax adhaerens]EDV27697.1 hypothetical protein TRIADDRAFT_53658 [Trichoplax adhaerens]RDD42082.1 CDP-diacylglycerol--glycerol-3-phosphate 3-phosphatidyltransferase, mitochondrial [Trichoplax sp. H2]|eukprot:XP_002109531.1 hypothetical protein TRIADDRAFT_53658 [Trichoplax adhaerens]